MLELATALAIVGLAFVTMLWDIGRRALDADVERVRMRTDAMKRADIEAVDARVTQLAAALQSTQTQLDAELRRAALGRR